VSPRPMVGGSRWQARSAAVPSCAFVFPWI